MKKVFHSALSSILITLPEEKTGTMRMKNYRKPNRQLIKLFLKKIIKSSLQQLS